MGTSIDSAAVKVLIRNLPIHTLLFSSEKYDVMSGSQAESALAFVPGRFEAPLMQGLGRRCLFLLLSEESPASPPRVKTPATCSSLES